jgi:hypothetical protein
MSRIERFGKHCNCPLPGHFLSSPRVLLKMFIAPFLQPRALLPLDSSPQFRFANQHNQTKLATYSLPYIRLLKAPNRYILCIHPEDGNCNICRNVG